MFLGLIAYLVYFNVVRKEEFLNSSYNTRQNNYAERVIRGTIYSADGQELAKTTTDENGDEVRTYPFGSLFAQVVGYTGKGNSGLESSYNYMLMESHTSKLKQVKNEFSDAKNPGDSLYTTLNTTLQQAAADALDGYRGAVVVLEAKTGRVLANVSNPVFNPNTIDEDWEALNADDESGVFLNRGLQGRYPPGSTFKIVTSLAYLRQNGTLDGFSFDCDGELTAGNYTIHCSGGEVHGPEDFAGAFAHSCNSAFAQIGLGLDKDAFRSLADSLYLNSRLDPESHRLAYADKGGYISRYICCETASNRSSLQWCLDWEHLFKLGFKGIREEALARMAELDPDDPVDQSEKRPYLEAIVTVSEGIVTWARRHAELARRKAAEETDPRRKQELLTIASNCEWVPENPPRTFHEAIQAHWFTQAFARLEQKISSNPTNGRMDQLFWPYYQKDLAEGRIDEEGAIELFQCMWASMAQCLDLAITPYNKATHEGYSHWEAVTVGGQTRDGRDATNELSYIIMRSKRECPLHYPDLAARVHSRSPERFLTAVAEMIKQGCGFPKLLNDDEIIPPASGQGRSPGRHL